MYSLSELSIFPSILLFSLWGIGGWLMLSSHLVVLPNERGLVGFGLGLFVNNMLVNYTTRLCPNTRKYT